MKLSLKPKGNQLLFPKNGSFVYRVCICDQYQRSTIPGSEFVYHLPDKILVKCDETHLIDSDISFSELFGGEAGKELKKRKEEYQEYVKKQSSTLVHRFKKSRKSAFSMLEYSDYFVAVCDCNEIKQQLGSGEQKAGIPEYYNKQILELHKKEEEHFFDKCKEDYEKEKQNFTDSLEEVDDLMADVERSMNRYPSRYNEDLRKYFRTTLPTYLDQFRTAITKINQEETKLSNWYSLKDSNIFKLVIPVGYPLLTKVMTIPCPVEENALSLYNAMMMSEHEYSNMINTADDKFTKAQNMMSMMFYLVTDFVIFESTKDAENRFPLYFEPCRVEFEHAISTIETYSTYMERINQDISAFMNAMKSDKRFVDRSTALEGVKNSLMAYDRLTKFYEPNAAICKDNQQKLVKVIDGIKPYILPLTSLIVCSRNGKRKVSDAGIEPATSRV